MEIGTSVIGVARKAAGLAYSLFEKLVCRRAYKLSTLYRDHRELIEGKPKPLGEHLGYQLFWEEYLHGSRQRSPTIEIRGTWHKRLSLVVVSVSASNDKVCYQDEIALRQVDQRRHRAALTAIPFRRPKIKGNWVYTPYDTFRVELIEVRDEAGISLMPRLPVVHITHPIDRLEVALGEERDYVEKWGRVFHLRFIEMEINEELVHIFAWRFHRSKLMQRLTAPMQSRRVAKTFFWCKNAFRARPLQRSLERHIAEYKEYLGRRELEEAAISIRSDEERDKTISG